MKNLYYGIGAAIVFFIVLLAINKGTDTIKIITNIGVAVIAGILVSVILSYTSTDTIKESEEIVTASPTATVVSVITATVAPSITNTPNNEDIYFDAQGFMNKYLSDMANAVNSNNFSKVEKYLKSDSDAYIEQKNYIVNYCKEKQIKESFKTVEILTTNKLNKYTVVFDTYETYDITSPSRGSRTSSFNTQYTVEYVAGDWKISKIVNK